MLNSVFHNKSELLSATQKCSANIKQLLEQTKVILDKTLIPLKKDSYHFLIETLRPESRIEKNLLSLLMNEAYKSETLSSGSAFLAIQFASYFIEEILKNPDYFNENEVGLLQNYEAVANNYKNILLKNHSNITEKELEDYIELTCENSLLSNAIKQALKISGMEGKIHVKDGNNENYVIEHKFGYNFSSLKPFKFLMPKIWEFQNVKVVLIDGIIERVSELEKILLGSMETKFPTLIIARGFSEEIVATIKVNNDYGKFNVMPVRLSSELESINTLNDIATVCGTDIVSVLKGEMIICKEFDIFPIVEKIRISMSELTIENSKTRNGVSQHLRGLLEKRQEKNKVEDISILIDKRIQSLISAAVSITQPNLSPPERNLNRIKIDLVLRNVKTILNYGQVNWDNVCSELKNYKASNILEKAFIESVRKIQNPRPYSFLSSYAGIFLIGKIVLMIMTSKGLIELVN